MELLQLMVIISCLWCTTEAVGSNRGPRGSVMADFLEHLTTEEPIFRKCGFLSLHFRSDADADADVRLLAEVLRRLRPIVPWYD